MSNRKGSHYVRLVGDSGFPGINGLAACNGDTTNCLP